MKVFLFTGMMNFPVIQFIWSLDLCRFRQNLCNFVSQARILKLKIPTGSLWQSLCAIYSNKDLYNIENKYYINLILCAIVSLREWKYNE